MGSTNCARCVPHCSSRTGSAAAPEPRDHTANHLQRLVTSQTISCSNSRMTRNSRGWRDERVLSKKAFLAACNRQACLVLLLMIMVTVKTHKGHSVRAATMKCA
jgi:hypothetical protein